MSLIRKHGAVLQAWACLDLVVISVKMPVTCKFVCTCKRVIQLQLRRHFMSVVQKTNSQNIGDTLKCTNNIC